ncbi:MAG: HypC/HybG/HupF family hydrogenase formation chaperone [Promethearchaeota archaeon]|nr:MAG: HypC/HybG/HupF family hydrogenase formation chaperone [Candidatus Lokiarchaeota archaeon]
MCLAIPGKIVEISSDGNTATVDFDGITQKIIVALAPDAEVGKYAVVHAGYAIEIMNEKEATEAIKQWEEISEDQDLNLSDMI